MQYHSIIHCSIVSSTLLWGFTNIFFTIIPTAWSCSPSIMLTTVWTTTPLFRSLSPGLSIQAIGESINCWWIRTLVSVGIGTETACSYSTELRCSHFPQFIWMYICFIWQTVILAAKQTMLSQRSALWWELKMERIITFLRTLLRRTARCVFVLMWLLFQGNVRRVIRYSN